MAMIPRIVCVMYLMFLGSSVGAQEVPTVLGWWRMDAEIGQRLTGATIQDASGGDRRHDATGRSWNGGSLMAFHELPGRYIYDPLTGKAYENKSSLRFESSAQQNGGGQSDFLEVDAGLGKRQPASFTIEGFIRNEGGIDKWHDIITMREPGNPHPHAWSLSTENLKGAKKLRFGGHKAPKGYWASYESNPSVTGPGWHHFAYVFEKKADGNQARLYWDGTLVTEASPATPAYTDAQRLYIGGSPGSAGWKGYLDEVRLTAAALTPEQFLQASDTPGKPEKPATPIALGLRKEPMKPLTKAYQPDLPAPIVGPASVHVPDDAGLANVKTNYGAKGDGMTDDTAAIKRAVAENVGRHATLYFPPGVYVVSEPIDWKNTKGEWNAFLAWQGAGMGQTYIYLRPGSVEFGAAEKPRAVTSSGSIPGMGGSNPVTGAGNRGHNNYIMDMTFIVGQDNPGAVGVDFNASNTGAMENVRIVALDRAVDGLRLTRAVGCLLVKNVEIHGFDRGVRLGGDLYGSTLTNIHVQGQREVGMLNEGHTVALQRLTSVNTVPAIRSVGTTGHFTDAGLMVMIDSKLTGGDSKNAAIENSAAIIVRNVSVEGYGSAIKQDEAVAVKGASIGEYVWPKTAKLFDGSPSQTLNLPVVDPPAVPDVPVDQWVNVTKFGVDPSSKEDQSAAIQKAIDSGAKVLYFPRGGYRVFSTVVVRGNVQRIIGYQSWWLGSEGDAPTRGTLRFENTGPLVFERFNFRPADLQVATDQPVVLRHIMGLPEVKLIHDRASVFSENAVGQRIALREGQAWRAWQLNIEVGGPAAMVENHGGTFWVLGYKTEKGNTVLRTTEGGKSEILGGLWYPAQGFGKDKEPVPAMIVEDGKMSASFSDMSKGGGTYQVLVQETRDGRTEKLPRSSLQRKWGMSGSVSLYRSGE